MGVATSIAHTIGLHRNPERSNMDSKRTKLWKRIWWSTYMRDRLIALGMRRPTRIKSEDYDVPMLTLDDFEIAAIPESVTCIPATTSVARDVEKQRAMAIMCIEKAKLCLCISHVLSKQYCVLNNNQGLMNDRTTMMLLPKKLDPETCEVKACDEELQDWYDNLPSEAAYPGKSSGHKSLDLHKSLLHMVFYTTLSALHRPQVLPSAPSATPNSPAGVELLEISRRNVRRAANAITEIASSLDSQDLVKYLPTTGVTVLLPAIIIHLLDIKAPEEDTRRSSLRGFCQCMQVMGKLRDIYAAADYSTAFLEAAIRKAGIQISLFPNSAATPTTTVTASATNAFAVPARPHTANSLEDLVNAGKSLDVNTFSTPAAAAAAATATFTPTAPVTTVAAAAAGTASKTSELTPPPDTGMHDPKDGKVSDEEVARRLETFLASTPPDSDHDHHHNDQTDTEHKHGHHGVFGSDGDESYPMWYNAAVPEFDQDDFDSLLNLDAVGEGFAFEVGEAGGLWGVGGEGTVVGA